MFIYYTWYGTSITGNISNNDGSFVVLDDNGYGVTVTRNRGQNFGAKGFLPIVGTTNATAAIEVLYFNGYGLDISDNTLGEENPGYSGIDFSAMLDASGYAPDYVGYYWLSDE